MALPGMLTLLSVLAVMWGAHSPAHDLQPRAAAATSVAPNLPEWRAAAHPGPPSPLLGTPPPEPPRWLRVKVYSAGPARYWNNPRRPRDLTWWGRRQTDGG